jgi:hypothetical protein
MISQEFPLASWFLLVNVAVFLFVYALPLTFAPLRWARWFRWPLPSGSTDLTVYLARCVGMLALAIIAMAVQAVPDPRGHRMVFELIAWATGFMVPLHVWGALRRTQPWTETLEIALYAAVCAGSSSICLRLA